MKRKLTYRQKLLYVFIGSGVFMLVLYNMAISNTITIAVENSDLEAQIVQNQDAPEQLRVLKEKLVKIQQVLGKNEEVERDLHQLLLQLITERTQQNNIILKDFPQPYETVENGYRTQTITATLEGDFIQMLKLLYFLETNYKGGKVVATNFKTIKEHRTRIRKLNTTIYLQNVKAENHEENS